MSDTLLNLIARPEEYDPFKPQQAVANVAATQASTQGQQLQNQGTGLQLQLQQARLAPYLAAQGGAGFAGMAPGMAAPGGGGALGGLATLASLAAGSGGGSAPAAPAGAGVAPSAGGAVPGGAGSAPALTAPGDIAQQMYGVAMPPANAMALAFSKNPAADVASIANTRRDMLYQYAASATPATWDSHVGALLQEGWLSSAEAAQLFGHPELQPKILQSYTSPDAGSAATTARLGMGMTTDANGNPVASPSAIGAKGAITGAEQDATNKSKLLYQPAIDQAENGPLADRAGLEAGAKLPANIARDRARPYDVMPDGTHVIPAMPGVANPDGTNQPTRGVDLLNTGAIPPSAYAARINGTENSTGNPGARNPNSSATGNGQFIDGTWLQLMRQAHPELAGQSDQQVLALRSKPAMAAEMTAAYGQQNAGVLQQSGFPVTSATLGMAHRLGPADAMTVMNADLQKPLAALLSGDVIARNPDLAQQTVGSFINASKNKYGNQPVAFAQPAVATRSAAPPSPGRGPAGGVSPFGPDQTSAAQPVASAPSAAPVAAPLQAAVGNPAAPIRHADERFPAPTPSIIAGDAGRAITPAAATGPGAFGGGYAPGPAGNPGNPIAGNQPPPGTQPSPASAVQTASPPPPAPGALAGPTFTQLPDGSTAVRSPLSSVTLAQQKTQAENDVTQMGAYRTGLLTDAQKAAQSNSLIDTMRTEAQQFAQGGGANADWRDMQATMNNWSNLFGGSPFPAVSNVEAFNKAAGQLVREAASTVSPRVGVQELQMVQKTLLSDDTSPQGFQKIADQLQGIADYRIAKSAAASQATGNPNAFEADWNAHVTPLAFIVNRMPTADAQQLAVQLNKTEQGKRTLNGIMQQMHYADQTGLFRAVQP